jgi:hypothetical protein
MNKDEPAGSLPKQQSYTITIDAHIAREMSPTLDDPS